MKRIVIAAALTAVLAVFAASAQGDPVAGMTCGNNGPGAPLFTSGLNHDSGGWTAHYDNNCGQGKTFTLELQASSDERHWSDVTGHTIKTSGPCGGGCAMTLTNRTLGCSNSLDYRAKVWSYQNVYDQTSTPFLGC